MDNQFQKDLMSALDDVNTKKFLIQAKEDEISMIKRQIEETTKANEELSKQVSEKKLQLEKQEALYCCERLNQKKLENEVEKMTRKVQTAVEKGQIWEAKLDEVNQFHENKCNFLNEVLNMYSQQFSQNFPHVKNLMELEAQLANAERAIAAKKEVIAAERIKKMEKARVEAEYFEAFKKKCVEVAKVYDTMNKLKTIEAKRIGTKPKPPTTMPPPQPLPLQQQRARPGKRDFRAELDKINQAARMARLEADSRKRAANFTPRREPRIFQRLDLGNQPSKSKANDTPKQPDCTLPAVVSTVSENQFDNQLVSSKNVTLEPNTEAISINVSNGTEMQSETITPIQTVVQVIEPKEKELAQPSFLVPDVPNTPTTQLITIGTEDTNTNLFDSPASGQSFGFNFGSNDIGLLGDSQASQTQSGDFFSFQPFSSSAANAESNSSSGFFF